MKGLKIRVPDAPAYIAIPARRWAPTRRRSLSPRSTWRCRTAPSTRRKTRCRRSRRRSSTRCRRTSSLTGHIVDVAAHRGVAARRWNKLTDAEKKIFTDVMQEAADKAGREIAASEAELVDEFKKKGNNVIVVDKKLPRRGAEEHQADRPGLPPEGLRPHHQASSEPPKRRRQRQQPARWTTMSIDDAQGDGRRRRVPRPATRRWTCPARPSRPGSRWRFFWVLGLTVFYQFITRYVLQRLGRLDRGDRALPADRRRCSSAPRSAWPRTTTSRSTSSTATCRAASAAGWRRLVDVLRIAFFAATAVLTVQMMLKMGNDADDHRRPADEHRLRRRACSASWR